MFRRGQNATIGLLATIAVVLCVTAICALSYPLLRGNDEPLHLDYAWQISQGHLPEFYEGTSLPLPGGKRPYQFAAHHPPLYYLVQSPITGYFINTKRDLAAAGLSARITNICIGIFCVLALGHLAYIIGRGRQTLTLGVPAIFCSFLPFVKLTSLIFNDSLALLFAICSLTLIWRVAREGPSYQLTLWMAVWSTLGMATRATNISLVALSCLVIPLHLIFVQKTALKESLIRSIRPILTITACIIVGIGWFYLYNYLQSGSWSRAAPQTWAVAMNRHPKTISAVLGKSRMWMFPFTELYGSFPFVFRLWILMPAASLLCLTFGYQLCKYRKNIASSEWVSGSLLLLIIVGAFVQQIVHATGYGAFNPRYLILVFLVLALIFAQTLTLLPRWISITTFSIFSTLGLTSALLWCTQATSTKTSSLLFLSRTTRDAGGTLPLPFGLLALLVSGAILFSAVQIICWSRASLTDNANLKTAH